MSNIDTVRKALWDLYSNAKEIEGKSSEAYCELIYPTFWECKTREDFLEPIGINIYSYAFGPSRMHYVRKANKTSAPNYYTRKGPDIYKEALDFIKEWALDFENIEE